MVNISCVTITFEVQIVKCRSTHFRIPSLWQLFISDIVVGCAKRVWSAIFLLNFFFFFTLFNCRLELYFKPIIHVIFIKLRWLWCYDFLILLLFFFAVLVCFVRFSNLTFLFEWFKWTMRSQWIFKHCVELLLIKIIFKCHFEIVGLVAFCM